MKKVMQSCIMLMVFLILINSQASKGAEVLPQQTGYQKLFSPLQVKQPMIDTLVASQQLTATFSTLNILLVGNNPSPSNGVFRTFLQFDLSDIPKNSKIQSAKIQLNLTGYTTADPEMTVTAYRTLKAWDNNITWQFQDVLDFVDLSVPAATRVQQSKTTYEWEVTELLQKWIDTQLGTQPFGIQLRGDESPNYRVRTFGSNECTDKECIGRAPVLIYTFSPPTVTPTSTPTDTPTHTPTPTFTPTPTAGISSLTLLADPTGEIRRGQEITYSIGYQNGGYALSNVSIENVIPTQLVLITDSFSYSGQIPGTPTIVDNKITWNVASTLPISASGSVSYRAARPTFSPTAILTTPASITDTPTATITITPTNTNTPTRTPIVNTPTAINTLTPTATNPPTGTVSATSTPIPTVPTSQVAVEVVAIPNDPQNFEFVGSLGSFALDDAIPDDNDSITKRKTFDWKNANVPIVITQKTLISWTLYSVVCYPPGNTSLQAAAQTSTLTLDAGILATNENLYCAFINVRNDYLGSPASQATADALIRSVSVGLQGTPVPTAVPTVETLEPIVNEGATIHWVYEATPDALLSNSTRNPPIQMYLPIIAR